MDQLERLKKTNRILLVIMVATLAVFGAALMYFTTQYLEQAALPSSSPPQEPFQQISLLLLVITMLGGMPAVGFGAYVMYLGSRIRISRQWPPPGLGFRIESPVNLGHRAGWVGFVVMVLGLVLVIVGLSLPLIGWRLGEQF